MASGPPQIALRGSALPMENSPPGIQTIPSGAGPGGALLLEIVGANSLEAGTVGGASRLQAVQNTVSRTMQMARLIAFLPLRRDRPRRQSPPRARRSRIELAERTEEFGRRSAGQSPDTARL